MSKRKSRHHISGTKKTYSWNKRYFSGRFKMPSKKIDWPILPKRKETKKNQRYFKSKTNKYMPRIALEFETEKQLQKYIKRNNLYEIK